MARPKSWTPAAAARAAALAHELGTAKPVELPPLLGYGARTNRGRIGMTPECKALTILARDMGGHTSLAATVEYAVRRYVVELRKRLNHQQRKGLPSELPRKPKQPRLVKPEKW